VPTIAALYVYPVKSCRGIAPPRARLTAAGLQHDREWMVVTPEGRFLTQRELPQLAVVATSLDDTALGLAAPGRPPLRVPLQVPANAAVREVNVWGEACLGIDEGDAAANWFGDLLSRPVRLVRFDRSRRRPTDPDWSQGLDGESLFSDGFPVLLLSQASLDDLNCRLPTPLPVDRFRPNVLLAGCEPYEEDRIGALSTPDVRLRLVKPCTRCSVTTVEQSTGVFQGDEPLRTLKSYRWDAGKRGVLFGQNAIVEAGEGGTLAVGDVLEAAPPVPRPSSAIA
jgi:uncharacterized protein YcbX